MIRRPFHKVKRPHPLVRVVQHDKPEMLKLHPEIEPPDPKWLAPALYLAWTGIAAVMTWTFIRCVEMVVVIGGAR